jgi:hypothetical protein
MCRDTAAARVHESFPHTPINCTTRSTCNGCTRTIPTPHFYSRKHLNLVPCALTELSPLGSLELSPSSPPPFRSNERAVLSLSSMSVPPILFQRAVSPVVPMHSCPQAGSRPAGGSADVEATRQRHCRSERSRSRGGTARAAPVVLGGGAARGGGRRL